MIVLYVGLVGLVAFILGAAILGVWLRQHPSKANAENASRIMHFLFFAGLGTPFLISIFYPGLKHLDTLLDLQPLPWRAVFLIAGMVLALPGPYLFVVSNKSLRALGSGTNAFILTKHIVETDLYKYTRNPMSLGYYLLAIAVGFISGSTLLTLFALLGLIPAHLFFLKFFEELELELRLGESYKAYKEKTAFLIPTSSAK